MNPANFRCKSVEETVLHYTESTFKETIGKISFWIQDRNRFVPLGQWFVFLMDELFNHHIFHVFLFAWKLENSKLSVCPALIHIQDFKHGFYELTFLLAPFTLFYSSLIFSDSKISYVHPIMNYVSSNAILQNLAKTLQIIHYTINKLYPIKYQGKVQMKNHL